MLVQGDVDGGQSIHSPAGVLLTGWEHTAHESAYKVREAALHDTLPHGTHQVELKGGGKKKTYRKDQIQRCFSNAVMTAVD